MTRPISLYVRDADGTTIIDPLFDKAHTLRKGSQYPAGVYGTATFTLPRDPGTRPSRLALGHEVRISLWVDDYYLAENVYHGYVESLEEIKRGGVQETHVTCVGAWGYIMQTRGIQRNWADTRLSADVWEPDTTAAGAEKATVDRQDRIRITPRGVAWTTGEQYVLTYQTPTGELVGKVTNNYDFNEEGYRPPSAAKHNDDPGGTNTFTDLTNAIDGNTATEVTITITSDDYIYIGAPNIEALNLIRFDLGTTVNANAATMAAEYRQAATDTSAAQWSSLAIADGTASGGATLAVDGNMAFTLPDDWARTTVDDDSEYWIRLQPSANLTANIKIKEIQIGDSAQAWELALYNGTTDEWSVTASGTGSQNVDLGTAAAQLYFEAKANQTAADEGTYGEVTSLIVYASRNHAAATLGTVNIYQIALDIVDLLGVDETLISATLAELDSSLTLSLVPFITDGFETFASILARAAGYGNTGSRPVGFGLRPPFFAPDNRPPLFLEAYPVFSDHDYYISSDDCDLSVRANLDDVWNWIVVEYTDAQGNVTTITPDDDADLTDATSVDQYGKRVRRLVLPLSNPTQAKSFGARYLDRHKDPTYAVTRPLSVSRLQAKNGGWVPAAQIDAGKRLWITDLPNLTGQEIPSGVVFLIVATDYSHDAGTVNLSLGGYPDNLAMILARMELLPQ